MQVQVHFLLVPLLLPGVSGRPGGQPRTEHQAQVLVKVTCKLHSTGCCVEVFCVCVCRLITVQTCLGLSGRRSEGAGSWDGGLGEGRVFVYGGTHLVAGVEGRTEIILQIVVNLGAKG